MKIALAQMDVKPGQPRKNLESMLRMVEQAKRQQVDLIAFPEMAVGGYLLGDKWLSDEYCRYLMEFNDALLEASDGIAIAYGNIFLDEHINDRVGDSNPHPNEDGRSRKYNAVYVVQNRKPASRKQQTRLLPEGVQPKTLLPNYRIFDDKRYFFSTTGVAQDFGVPLEGLMQPFMISVGGRQVPIGFEICEDLWCADYRRNSRMLNPTKMLISNGAAYIVNISASPWTFGKNSARDRRVRELKADINGHFVPFLYVNCTGAQNNGKNIVTFDGGSTVYNADGLPIQHSAAPYQEELIIVERFDGSAAERQEKPAIAQKHDAIIAGIRHVRDMMGAEEQPGYVVGLSGGVDSAVVAALLVDAVGRERVMAINMPTSLNSAKTRESARHVAEQLGIAYHVLPIEELAAVNARLIDSVDADGRGARIADSPLHLGNLLAKIRGTSILSNIAAKYGALFTNNSNKVETMLGYATLYGDVGGAIAPIGDLTKSEVFAMGKHINQLHGREVIPLTLFPDQFYHFTPEQIQPSAELEHGQVDPMTYIYHCALVDAFTDYRKRSQEDVMRWYLDGSMEKNLNLPAGMMQHSGLDHPAAFIKDLDWFVRSAERSVFKQVQSPPIIITSKSAFGFDIRRSILPYAMTRAYEELQAQVLAMDTYAEAPHA
ncbi:MAG TPA: NAD(+) synthase [Candidatus Nanoarchaeia archaeon]|nr:NAD(+) synthase [Candidatus Nanoarchaeia archaeon]